MDKCQKMGGVLPVPKCESNEVFLHEIRRIRRCPAIEPGSVTASTDSSGKIYVKFALNTDQLTEPVPTPIQDVEPITLVYNSIEHIGVNAPTVWSGRDNFPRDIGHINPTPTHLPVSLCLARVGLQPVYDRHGVDGVLHRLISWLHDAKTGQLMMDGWEPVPIGVGQNYRSGLYDIAFFQNLANCYNPHGDSRFGIARLLSDDLGGRVVFLSPETEWADTDKKNEARKQVMTSPRNERGVAAYIPWVYVWSDRDNPIDQQLFGVWNSYGEIELGLTATGISEKLPNAIMEALITLTDQKNNKPVGLLVGVWRPQPISDDIFGISEDITARGLEIRAYLLHCSQKYQQSPIDDTIKVEQLICTQLLSRKMLEFTSGRTIPEPLALVGCGALGSCIGDFLLRSGISKISLFDTDTIAPHNLARHTSSTLDLNTRKVDHLKSLATSMTMFSDEIDCTAVPKDITTLSNEEFLDLATTHRIIVDATASERVRRKLSAVPLPQPAQIIRAEIFDSGLLGILFITGVSNNPNLIDLYYEVCTKSLENESIEQWLCNEQSNDPSSEELLLGMGCASATTRMPKYFVAQHASAFMHKIVDNQCNKIQPGIGINPLQPDGTPVGWTWFPYCAPTVVLEAINLPGWNVRLTPSASLRLEKLRMQHTPLETGGYLYGGYDFPLKQIFVSFVSDIPPGTLQSETDLSLGPAGRTRLERSILQKTANKLSLVGTWHSHPNSGFKMSNKDKKTIAHIGKKDKENGVPSLLLIASAVGDGAYVWI